MDSSIPGTQTVARVGAALSRYGSWIACCLSRGRRAPLREADVARLAEEFGEQRVAGGTFVFRQGDEAARVHVVREGAVELSRVLGGRRVAFQVLGPGDVFGDVPAFLGEPEPFDARALDDAVVLSLDAAALFGMLARRPQVARRWMVSMAERMSGLQQRVGDLLAGPLDAQLASILLRESAAGDVRLTQKQLAEMLGAARTSVQRVLKRLEEEGLVALHYRRIEILDTVALEALLDGAKEPMR